MTRPDDARPVLVSACLAGEPCRYDGRAAPHPAVLRLVAQGRAVPVCPELLGGLGVPREPAELCADRIGGKAMCRAVCRSGRDVTAEFLAGAQGALEVCRAKGCQRAILKARSPSCGSGRIYDGTFSGVLVPGDGVLAALLKENNIAVASEKDL